MSDKRLPKRCLLSGRLEGAEKRGPGGQEKVWLTEVERDVKAFGIAGDWRQRATQALEWYKAVTEGAQAFMDRWRADEADKAEDRRRKREAKEADLGDRPREGIPP